MIAAKNDGSVGLERTDRFYAREELPCRLTHGTLPRVDTSMVVGEAMVGDTGGGGLCLHGDEALRLGGFFEFR